MSDSLRCHGLYSPWNSPGQNPGGGSQPFPFPGVLSNPGIEPRSPTLQADYFPAEPQGMDPNQRMVSTNKNAAKVTDITSMIILYKIVTFVLQGNFIPCWLW